MHNMLFETDIKRTYQGSSKYSESTFQFLNRSSKRRFSEVRKLINKWYSNFPREHRQDLKSRIKSGDDSSFNSAFFELYLHEFLKKLEYSVEIHPNVSGINSRPDFLVTKNDEEFYLEATCSEQRSASEEAKEKIKNTFLDELNKIKSDNFFIGIETKGNPEFQPSTKDIKRELRSKLQNLDPDKYEGANFKDLPKWTYTFGEWELTLFPIPKKRSARGKKSNIIGLISPEASFVDDFTPLKKSVQNKANKYKKFDKPFIIAVNVLNSHIDEITLFDALLGKEQFEFKISNPENHKLVRKKNGAFLNQNGPTNTRVSAVLLGESILPWSVSQLGLTLFHHPWANIKYEGELNILPRYTPNDNKMEYIEGLATPNILFDQE